MSNALAADATEFWATRGARDIVVANPTHDLEALFDDDGVLASSAEGTIGFKLVAWGHGSARVPVSQAGPQTAKNVVRYPRGPITEWYVNGPLGLEQGFTLDAPPPSDLGGPLTLAIELSGSLEPTAQAGKDGLAFGGSLRYGGLAAFDATGAELPAWLEVSGQTLFLRVMDRDARYPVTIDPFIQQAKLTASDGAAFDSFGLSVAVSGNTVVVGAPLDDGQRGSVYVFTKPAGGWTSGTETAKLTASDGESGDGLGVDVAVAGDTVVAGSFQHDVGADQDQGAVYLFSRPAGGWTSGTERAQLTASDGEPFDHLGTSVAMSGETVVAGAESDDVGSTTLQGSAYVFTEPAGGWTSGTETAKLTASDGGSLDFFGWSVAVAGDTVVVGAPNHDVASNIFQGSAYVFTRPAGGWTSGTETAKLTASDGDRFDELGSSVAVSRDTVVAGAPFDDVRPVPDPGSGRGNPEQGSAYVFTEPSGGWTSGTETAKLTASDGMTGDLLGFSVTVSGGTIVAGARLDDEGSQAGLTRDQGSAYVFTKPAAGWTSTTETDRLTASDGEAFDEFGWSVRLSGRTLVVGAPYDDIGSTQDQGSAYVFVAAT